MPLVRKAKAVVQVFRSRGTVATLRLASEKLTIIRNSRRRGRIARLDGCSFIIDPARVPPDIRYLLLSQKYERPEREALKRCLLNPGLPVVELGGSLGVIACLTNSVLHNPRNHVVVEANPAVLPLLKENRKLNDAKFHIVHAALYYGASTAVLGVDKNILASSTRTSKSDGKITVPAVTLGEVLDRFKFDRCSLICDVEGSEAELFVREIDVIADRVQTMIVEIHDNLLGPETLSSILSKIRSAGFQQVFSKHETRAFLNL